MLLAPWVVDEMKTAALSDKRLNDRLRLVLSQLADRPTASIPAACGGNAEMTAAYRLFDNDKATFDNVLAPHVDATRKRVAAQPTVVLAQDTTEIDLTRPEKPVRGAGPLDGDTRVGALLHLLHAFAPDGTPLGTVAAMPWTREPEVIKCASLTRAQRAAIPIEKKESYRWITTLRQAHEVAQSYPNTQCICVADSEADIYEFLVEGMANSDGVRWIARASQDRALSKNKGADANSESLLRERVLVETVLYTQTIKVRGRKAKIACEKRGRRQPRQSREAEVTVRAAQVTLRAPSRPDCKLPVVTINAVLACEENPPEGDEPIEWLLLTDLPIGSLAEVRQIIAYYCLRWMIEVFFRVLKSGCRVEERRFEQIDRLLTCLAVYLIVAWRTLYVCRLGRSCPEISCESVFEPAEWKAAWKVVRREDPPQQVPPLGVVVNLIAQLGGYINRKRSDPPGPQTVWLGLQRVHDFALCWKLFGPEAENRLELV
jgi:hypothetical protein